MLWNATVSGKSEQVMMIQKPLSIAQRQNSLKRIKQATALIEELVPQEQKRFSQQRKRQLENALSCLRLHAGKLGIMLPDLGLLYVPERYLQQARHVSEQLCNEVADRQPQYYVTVDLLVSHPASRSLLLIQRRKPPFEGSWALPGGHLERNESPEQAARRELQEETRLLWQDAWTLVQLGAFGDPGRDPRGHYISILYGVLAEVPEQPIVQAGDDAGAAAWFPLQTLPALAFDHAQMVQRSSNLMTTKICVPESAVK